MKQINDNGCNPAAILHRRADARWKVSPCAGTAGGIGAGMGTMFGDTQGLWLGQLKNLPACERDIAAVSAAPQPEQDAG